MGDERRWAARYQFLDELWRGRDRIVCDRELEAALHAGVEGPIAELLAGLVPQESGDDRAWVVLHNDRRAASFARERGGTAFVGLGEAAEVASDEAWQIAIVHLGDADDASTRAQLLGPIESFLEVLGERLEDDPERSVVLSLRCGSGPHGGDEDRSFELLSELVEQLFGDGRIYGLTRPNMAAFYEFGPVVESDRGDARSSGEPDIEVDNTLGSESPRFEAFLAVIGAGIPGEGVTFIELPAPAETRPAQGADDDLAGVRAQLHEAQRRGDLHAIERQSLLEKLEHAEDRIASLEEQLDLIDTLEGSARVEPSAGASEGPRLDELLVREQALRWELERARSDAERLEARPVEELEAEVASLRAELARTQADLDLAQAELDELDELDQAELDADERGTEIRAPGDGDEPSPAQIREWQRARVTLDLLMRKLERGGQLSALELHRELASLKRLL